MVDFVVDFVTPRGRIKRRARTVQILASVEAAKIFLGACGAKGKASPDCHFWSFFGVGDVSGAHENIKCRAAPCSRHANTPPFSARPPIDDPQS